MAYAIETQNIEYKTKQNNHHIQSLLITNKTTKRVIGLVTDKIW